MNKEIANVIFPEVVVGDLSLLKSQRPQLTPEPSGPANIRGKERGGFTLVELLVVVLIIGILAAVALPQYNKAVNKSRTVQALTLLKSLKDAQEVFFMENNTYTNDISELDIDIPASLIFTDAPDENKPNQYMFRCKELRTCQAKAANPNLPHLEYHMAHVGERNYQALLGKFWCWVSADKTELAQSICKSMGRYDEDMATSPSGTFYIIN